MPKPYTHPHLSDVALAKADPKNGFTLIEVLVVFSLGILIMVTVISLFTTSLNSRAKVNISKTLKEEGTYTLNQMQFLIRNAKPLEDCEDVASTHPEYLDIVSRDSGVTRLANVLDSNSIARIASNSAYFTNAGVSANDSNGNNTLFFTCEQGYQGAGQYVTIEFALYKVSETGEVTTAHETFRGSVLIRNATGIQ